MFITLLCFSYRDDKMILKVHRQLVTVSIKAVIDECPGSEEQSGLHKNFKSNEDTEKSCSVFEGLFFYSTGFF